MFGLPLLRPAARVELAGLKVLAQVLVGRLQQLRVVQDLLDLGWRGVAPDVLLLRHLSRARALRDPVHKVPYDLLLTRGTRVHAEQAAPERPFLLFFGHARAPLAPFREQRPPYPQYSES